jgi:hypothetical protein
MKAKEYLMLAGVFVAAGLIINYIQSKYMNDKV